MPQTVGWENLRFQPGNLNEPKRASRLVYVFVSFSNDVDWPLWTTLQQIQALKNNEQQGGRFV